MPNVTTNPVATIHVDALLQAAQHLNPRHHPIDEGDLDDDGQVGCYTFDCPVCGQVDSVNINHAMGNGVVTHVTCDLSWPTCRNGDILQKLGLPQPPALTEYDDFNVFEDEETAPPLKPADDDFDDMLLGLREDYKMQVRDDLELEENSEGEFKASDGISVREWLAELLQTEMQRVQDGLPPREAVLAFYREKIEERSHETLVQQAARFERKAAEKVLLTLEQAQNASLDSCLAPPFTGEIKPVKWIIPNWLENGTVTLLAGKGGVGKSRLALQTAVQLALGGGRCIFGDGAPLFRTARQVKTLYLSWEDDVGEYHRRLASQIHPETPPTPETAQTLDIINQCIRFADLRERGPLWAPWEGGSKHTDTVCEQTPLFKHIAESAAEHGAELIVVDTVAAAFQGNENNRALVRQFVTALSVLANNLNASVLLISHPSKSSDVSGSTDWENGCRAVWNLQRHDDGLLLVHRKANHAPIQEDIYLAGQHYPYHAENISVKRTEIASTGTKMCKGYEGYTCDMELAGRAERCPECKHKHNHIKRHGRASS